MLVRSIGLSGRSFLRSFSSAVGPPAASSNLNATTHGVVLSPHSQLRQECFSIGRRAFPCAGLHSLPSPTTTAPTSILLGSPDAHAIARRASMATMPKDPERPKRPLSAYFRFAAAYREKHNLKGGVDSTRKTGEVWKKMSEAEKKPFADVAARESEIYKKKFEEYKASGKMDAWKRDPEKPKRPLTPYLAWSVERRKAADVSKLSVTDSAKLISADWKKVPQTEKDALSAKFKTQTEKFNKDMEAYKASGKEEAWLKRTGRLAATEKEQAKKQAAKDKEAKLKEKAKATAAKAKDQLKLKKQKEKEARAKAMAAKAKEQLKLKKQKEKEARAKAAEKKKLVADKAKAQKEKERLAKKVAAERLKKKKAAEAKTKAADAAKKKAAKEKVAAQKKAEKEKAAAVKAKATEKANDEKLKQAQSAQMTSTETVAAQKKAAMEETAARTKVAEKPADQPLKQSPPPPPPPVKQAQTTATASSKVAGGATPASTK